jgi:hypothetical protein
MPMNEQDLAELIRWARSLGENGDPELAAAAKAILLLVAEIDRLQVALEAERAVNADAATADEGIRYRLRRLARLE